MNFKGCHDSRCRIATSVGGEHGDKMIAVRQPHGWRHEGGGGRDTERGFREGEGGGQKVIIVGGALDQRETVP